MSLVITFNHCCKITVANQIFVTTELMFPFIIDFEFFFLNSSGNKNPKFQMICFSKA